MASKWFKKDVQVSDSEDEDEEDVSEEEVSDAESSDDEEEKPKTSASGAAAGASARAQKWFKASGDDDEDEESEEEDDDDEDDDDGFVTVTSKKTPAAADVSAAKKTESVPVKKPTTDRRRLILDSDSEDESERRVVRSHKDKHVGELRKAVDRMYELKKQNAWREIQDQIQTLNKALEKVTKVQRDIPKMYIKLIVSLEDGCSKAAKDKSLKTKLPALDVKAIGSCLSRIRKNNADFKPQISEYEKHPELFEDEETEEGDEEEEEEDEERTAKKAAAAEAPGSKANKWFKKEDADEESSDEEDDMDLSEDEDEDDIDEDDIDMDEEEEEARPTAKPAEKKNIWLKAGKAEEEKKTGGKKSEKKKVAAITTAAATSVAKKPKKDRELPQPKKKAHEAISDWTNDLIDENIARVKQSKGKRGIDPQEQYDLLKVLYQNSTAPAKQIEILLLMISISFDIGSASSYCMPVPVWNNNYLNFIRILHILDHIDSQDVILVEEDDVVGAVAPEDAAASKTSIRVPGNFITVFERLDDEFTKSLQYLDPHTQAYVNRLNDEAMLMDLAERLFVLYRSKDNMDKATRIALRLFNRLYYKKQDEHERMLRKQRDQVAQIMKDGGFSFDHEEIILIDDLAALLKQFSALIYKYIGSELDKSRTMLLLVSHLATFGKFYESRDMLLMSRIQESIQRADVSLQVLYNRALAQLGLCAFRNGMIHDAHQCLQELCSVNTPARPNKLKDLLAQNLTSIKPVMELRHRQEQERMMPYHMHINLSKLEAVHLICAMLLEIPYMAQTNQSSFRLGGKKKKMISKTLRKQLDFYDKEFFLGPPENTREHIYFASKALLCGDWAQCHGVLSKLNIWKLVADNDETREMIKNKIKVEALRTYLFQYSRHYNSIALSHLAGMFDLLENKVHSIVSKMVINDELRAAWDQPTQTIVIDRNAEPTRVEQLLIQLTEKVSSAGNIAEMNERLLEIKTGGDSTTSYGGDGRKRTGGTPRMNPAASGDSSSRPSKGPYPGGKRPYQQRTHHQQQQQQQQPSQHQNS